jgi:hypothetical protein
MKICCGILKFEVSQIGDFLPGMSFSIQIIQKLISKNVFKHE